MVTGAYGHKYFLQREVGQGNFAVVYRCIDQCDPNRTPYACKVIDKAALQGQDSARVANLRNNILREIQILREVHHPNVLALHDLLETREHLYLFMPLFVLVPTLFNCAPCASHNRALLASPFTCSMAGGELFEKISSRGHFTEECARGILRQIASGIEYLHSIGICHRDIKVCLLFFLPSSHHHSLFGSLFVCLCVCVCDNSQRTSCAQKSQRTSVWSSQTLGSRSCMAVAS